MVWIPESEASDVYMYEHVAGFIVCQECLLGGSIEFSPHNAPGRTFKRYSEANSHLIEHRKAGHKVPDGALEMTSAITPEDDLVCQTDL